MGIVEDFYAALSDSQEPLGAEFESVLYANLWDLYETDDAQFVYWGA